jgi:hypothetical protein
MLRCDAGATHPTAAYVRHVAQRAAGQLGRGTGGRWQLGWGPVSLKLKVQPSRTPTAQCMPTTARSRYVVSSANESGRGAARGTITTAAVAASAAATTIAAATAWTGGHPDLGSFRGLVGPAMIVL